jgi:hypothetical protein
LGRGNSGVQAAVFIYQLIQSPQVCGFSAAVFGFPVVEMAFVEAVLAA